MPVIRLDRVLDFLFLGRRRRIGRLPAGLVPELFEKVPEKTPRPARIGCGHGQHLSLPAPSGAIPGRTHPLPRPGATARSGRGRNGVLRWSGGCAGRRGGIAGFEGSAAACVSDREGGGGAAGWRQASQRALTWATRRSCAGTRRVRRECVRGVGWRRVSCLVARCAYLNLQVDGPEDAAPRRHLEAFPSEMERTGCAARERFRAAGDRVWSAGFLRLRCRQS